VTDKEILSNLQTETVEKIRNVSLGSKLPNLIQYGFKIRNRYGEL